MENLRRFCIAISLTIMLAGTALAECPIPGEMNTPPCTVSRQQVTDDPATSTSISSERGRDRSPRRADRRAGKPADGLLNQSLHS